MPAEVLSADDVRVFVYHRFNDSRYPSTNISSEDFEQHLEILLREGFSVLTLGQVLARMHGGESLPQRCAVLSIDDGYRSFLTDGWPKLKEYGFPATLFVSTDTVGGADYLSWDELRQLQKEGVEIGNHSAGHGYLLDRLPDEGHKDWRKRIASDLERSQAAFATHLDSTPALFAYPYGEFSSELADLLIDAGFVAAFGQQSGVISGGQNLFTLPRFPVGGSYSAAGQFHNKLFMKRLPVEVLTPHDTLINEENPPVLKLSLKGEGVDRRSLRCFVPGAAECIVRAAQGEGEYYEVSAVEPLVGRRSKYTVTASDPEGATWYWYSQLWVMPDRRGVADQLVPR